MNNNENNTLTEKRQKANVELLAELNMYLKKYPDTRFIQALWGLGIINSNNEGLVEDRFYEEPDITLNKLLRIKNKIK